MTLIHLQDLVLLLVRLSIGIVFLYFGLPKIKNLKQNAQDFVSMGFKPGWFWGTSIALLEVFGSIFILTGFYPTLPALLLAGHMIVGTIWKIGWTKKSFPDWSYDILLFVLLLTIVVFGPGFFVLF